MLASVIYLQLARQMTAGNAVAEAAQALRTAKGGSNAGVLDKLEHSGAISASETMLVTLQRYLISCLKDRSPGTTVIESLARHIRVVYECNKEKDAAMRESMFTEGALAPVSWVPCKCHWRFRVAALRKLEAYWASAHPLSEGGGAASVAEPAMEGSGGAGSPALSTDAFDASAPYAAGKAMSCWVGGMVSQAGQSSAPCSWRGLWLRRSDGCRCDPGYSRRR